MATALRAFPTWSEAAFAIRRGDYLDAASIYGAMGERPAEAEARFESARVLIDHGQVSEGLEMLDQSLRFWRQVDGRYYIKAADGLRTRALGRMRPATS